MASPLIEAGGAILLCDFFPLSPIIKLSSKFNLVYASWPWSYMPEQTKAFPLQSAVMPTPQSPPFEIIDRSPKAIEGIYRQYLNPVYRYLLLRLSNPTDAEDLTSQVFLAVLEGLPRYRSQGFFSAWLFSIARRKVADFYRQHPQNASQDLDENHPAPEMDVLAQVIQHEDQMALLERVAALPEGDRELLRLRFAARLSFDEIAQLLNRKPSAVKMALYRLLERLESQMEARHA